MGVAVAATSVASATTTTSVTVPVPSGVTKNDILVALVATGNNAPTVTAPSGFAYASQAPVSQTSYMHIFWKRATAAESGDYVFTHASVNNRTGAAMRITGCPTSGDPFESITTGTATSTSTSALSLTTAVADNILIWTTTKPAAGSVSVSLPANFTSLFNTVIGSAAYQQLSRTKTSGTVQGTYGTSTTSTQWFGAVKPETGFGAFFL